MQSLRTNIENAEREHGYRMVNIRRAFNRVLAGGRTKLDALKSTFRTSIFWKRHGKPSLYRLYKNMFSSQRLRFIFKVDDLFENEAHLADSDDKREMYRIMREVSGREPPSVGNTVSVWWLKGRGIEEGWYSGVVKRVNEFNFNVEYDNHQFDTHGLYSHRWAPGDQTKKPLTTITVHKSQIKFIPVASSTSSTLATASASPTPSSYAQIKFIPVSPMPSSSASSSSASPIPSSSVSPTPYALPTIGDNIELLWGKKKVLYTGKITSTDPLRATLDGESNQVALRPNKRRDSLKRKGDWRVLPSGAVYTSRFKKMHNLSVGFQIKDGQYFRNAILMKGNNDLYAVRLRTGRQVIGLNEQGIPTWRVTKNNHTATHIIDTEDGKAVLFRYVEEEAHVPRPRDYGWDRWEVGHIIPMYYDSLRVDIQVYEPPFGGRGIRLRFQNTDLRMETVKTWWNTRPIVLHMHYLEAIDEPEIAEYLRNSDNIHKDSITNDRKGSIFDERYVNSRTCPLWYLCNSQLPTRASLKYVIKKEGGNEVRGFAAHKTFTDVVYGNDTHAFINLTWYYGKKYEDDDGNHISY